MEFEKPLYQNLTKKEHKTIIPIGSWVSCPSCHKELLKDKLKEELSICSECGYHFRIGVKERIKYTIDEGSFKEMFSDIISEDPLNFSANNISYKKKIKETKEKLKENEAITIGESKINGKKIILGIMNFSFMGGSLGSAMGEKIYRAMLHSIKKKTPFVLFSSSGGARMQEGALSLMQMAKTCAGLKQMKDAKVPFISILTDPTMGGVTASFASLGDVILAEKGAMIGFAGKRVIEQTIKEKLPNEFQKAEFLQEKGFVDMVVTRREMKDKLENLLNFFSN